MEKEKLLVIKAGGKLIEEQELVTPLLEFMAQDSTKKILVHGGGNKAGALSEQMGIPVKMIEGRRVTDAATLEIATMVYAGLINKNLVAQLQALGCSAIGLSGADGNTILSEKRAPHPIDFGWVGDVQRVNGPMLSALLELSLTPVICAITHDGRGQLLNTNADSIANAVGMAMSENYEVHLYLCFEKPGVLIDEKQPDSILPTLSEPEFNRLKEDGVVHSGMLPKLSNGFQAIQKGVSEVWVGNYQSIAAGKATRLVAQ
jgi:acetylglutamate kinase